MTGGADVNLDAVDLALLDAMHKHPRAGALELSRQVKVARATVQARSKRMEDAGVIAGYVPHVNLAAAGFGVQAFVTLQIAQGALDTVTAELEAIPGVLEAFATTGSGDVLCRIAAASHEDLQTTLLELNRSGVATRSISVMVLSVVVPLRSIPLLQTLQSKQPPKAPAYRRDGPSR
ncbi:Lrp/AsnC family transcriptional regulator [Rhodococcus sp. UFZ-B548]|uniref:Lrp/AsnC family transcriptional regulator n=1 Tax=Rhodococcus sp. UFZ-B548 TaxID=2742212 RepID=UPI0015F3F23B|nr:Lrp/AsnC ligand binding domain-containing protein [Rhodococcus sp. UFZ-B548]